MQPENAPYLPEPFERERFVHLTHGIEPVVVVGNAFYLDDLRPYLLLTLDLGRVTAEVRYEDPEHQYPHVYGPIDRDAIVAVRRMVRRADGTFLGVDDGVVKAGGFASGMGDQIEPCVNCRGEQVE